MKMTIQYSGLNQSKEWPHFAWTITLNNEVFSYKTGIGHCYSGKKLDSLDILIKDGHEFLSSKIVIRKMNAFDSVYAKTPNENDILQALFSDAECGVIPLRSFAIIWAILMTL